jgi:hypothetical protein
MNLTLEVWDNSPGADWKPPGQRGIHGRQTDSLSVVGGGVGFGVEFPGFRSPDGGQSSLG